MNTSLNRAELKVSGVIYGGWTSLRIERGMEQIAGTFSLGITERWAGQSDKRPIKAGQPCQVLIDGIPVITGYVDDANPSYDANQHGITVSGRDKTCDLVDCAAIHKGGYWKGAKLDKIAADLCAPFGIKVIVDTDVGNAIPSFKLNEGESVFEALERAARLRALLLVSDGLGNLVITRTARIRIPTALIEGGNILSASGTFSWKERYSHYIVKGQAAPDGDEFNQTTHTSPNGNADDPVINRYRPQIVIAEDQGNGVTLKQRAEWERSVRVGRGNRATIKVQGWKHDAGIWLPNRLVPVRSPYLDVDADLLISSVAYTLDESGTCSELQVCRAEAFEMISGVKGTRLKNAIRGANGAEQNVKKGSQGGKKKQDWSIQ
ncbi:MAG: hypothetical protein WC208_09535 [Gallionella sp.]|jgi:prophage tail gpP-like protein